MINHLFIIFICLLLTGCALDHDESYFPVTGDAVFLVKKGNGRSLYRINERGVLPDWQNALNIPDISDICSDSDGMWVSSGASSSVYFVPSDENEERIAYVIGQIQPHFIGVGNSCLMVGDTLQDLLAFISKKKGEVEFSMASPRSPGRIIYRSGKFYVQLGENQIGIYHEKAFALIDTIGFSYPVVDIQLDDNSGTVVNTLDTVLYQAVIDYNSNQLSQLETAVGYEKIQLPPFIRQRFGKEWTHDVFLSGGMLSYGSGLNPIEGVDDFEVDFFEGKLYFQQNDSLVEWDLRSREEVRRFLFVEKIVKSHYNIVTKGE